jgi:hypothetical protein
MNVICFGPERCRIELSESATPGSAAGALNSPDIAQR